VAPAVAGSIPVSHPIWNLLARVATFHLQWRPGVTTHAKLLRLTINDRGPVAQLDRASDFGSEGWGFDSLRGRHNYLILIEAA
jgi:hypothetical protein